MNICSHFQTVLHLQMKYSSHHHSQPNLKISWSVVSVFVYLCHQSYFTRTRQMGYALRILLLLDSALKWIGHDELAWDMWLEPAVAYVNFSEV